MRGFEKYYIISGMIQEASHESLRFAFFFLVQDELFHVKEILSPKRPFVAVVAGAKYDTKIGPLSEIYKKVDKLLLGGIIYNTFLCAKYNIKIRGVEVP
jgi:phosphoglycerate kinase